MKVFKPKGLGDLISQASERPICEGLRVKFIRLLDSHRAKMPSFL